MSMRRSQGFTLIEVLVAMSVFAVMTILAYMSLGQTLANADMLGERMDRLQAIKRTMRYLSNDLSAASPRPVRSELGDTYLPAVMVSAANDFVLAVTHGGWSNPAGLPLDSTYSNNALSTEILDGVESIEFRLLQDNGETTNQWPPSGAQGLAAERMRPRAVEIILTLEGEGEIRRFIEVAS